MTCSIDCEQIILENFKLLEFEMDLVTFDSII